MPPGLAGLANTVLQVCGQALDAMGWQEARVCHMAMGRGLCGPASTRVGQCQHMRCCDALPLSALHRAHCPESRIATVPHLFTTPMEHAALCLALYVRTRYKEVVTVQSTAASSQIRLPAAREGGAEGCQKPRCFAIPQAFITYDNTSVWRRHFARSADACQLRYPQKIVDIVLFVGYSSRGRLLVMQQCRWRRPQQAGRRHRRSWRVEVERMAAKTLGMRGNPTGSPGLWGGVVET
jgi:hypothetical protein